MNSTYRISLYYSLDICNFLYTFSLGQYSSLHSQYCDFVPTVIHISQLIWPRRGIEATPVALAETSRPDGTCGRIKCASLFDCYEMARAGGKLAANFDFACDKAYVGNVKLHKPTL